MLTDFFEPCRRLNVTTVANNMGGTEKTYTMGKAFDAGIYTNTQGDRNIAGQDAPATTYTVVTGLDTELQFDDVIIRIRDGLTLRVTSNAVDMRTPSVAAVQYHQVTAIKERPIV